MENTLLCEAGDEPVLPVRLCCQRQADTHCGTLAALASSEIGIVDFWLTKAGDDDTSSPVCLRSCSPFGGTGRWSGARSPTDTSW